MRLRVSVCAGLPLARIEPLILVDAETGIIQEIRELTLSLDDRRPAASARIGGSPGWSGSPASRVRLFQLDDARYLLEGAACPDVAGHRAPG